MKRLLLLCALCLTLALAMTGASPAFAQGGPVDAEAPTALAPLATAAPVGPAPAPSASADTRPARGPAVRERGGRRTRAGSSATGFLMIVIFVAFVGYYVLKKIRRY